MVREAELKDLSRLVALGERFYRDEGARTVSAEQLARFAFGHIGDDDKICLVHGDPIEAVLCGVISRHYLTGERTAFKTAWYASPKARGHAVRLLKAFQRWAEMSGARRIIVSGRAERTVKLLAHLNFQPLETVFTKDLP